MPLLSMLMYWKVRLLIYKTGLFFFCLQQFLRNAIAIDVDVLEGEIVAL